MPDVSRPLDVTMVSPFPPAVGGTAAAVSLLVRELANEGVNWRIIPTGLGHPGTGPGERITRLISFLGLGVKAMRTPAPLVHCHAVNWANLHGHAIVLAGARLSGRKTVLTLHAGNLLANLTGSKTKTRAKAILGLAHRVTAVSPELTEAVKALGFPDAQFSPNDFSCMDESVTKAPPVLEKQFCDTHNPTVVAVGAMERIHGIDILVEAMALLRETHEECGAIIIAFKSVDPHYKAEISALIKGHRLEDRILFPTELAAVLPVVKAADIFVRPTLSDGDSIAVREALEIGLPVVASDTGFRPPGPILFRPGDPVDLCEKICYALTLKRETQRQGELGTATRLFIELYKDLLASG